MAAWMPIDHFHSGFDTFTYLNLYRFIATFLHDVGVVSTEEPIRRYAGHDMVIADGRKMSKHLGNALAPDDIMRKYGADALRIAVLWAAGPERVMNWRHANLERAAGFLDRAWALYATSAEAIAASAGILASTKSNAAAKVESGVRASCSRVRQFIEAYRPNAAIEELFHCTQRVESFVLPRARSARLSSDDAAALQHALQCLAVAMSPFAPHLAEELASLSGLRSMAATAMWPSLQESATK
jgi:leucyl-tRNA synthetase